MQLTITTILQKCCYTVCLTFVRLTPLLRSLTQLSLSKIERYITYVFWYYVNKKLKKKLQKRKVRETKVIDHRCNYISYIVVCFGYDN